MVVFTVLDGVLRQIQNLTGFRVAGGSPARTLLFGFMLGVFYRVYMEYKERLKEEEEAEAAATYARARAHARLLIEERKAAATTAAGGEEEEACLEFPNAVVAKTERGQGQEEKVVEMRSIMTASLPSSESLVSSTTGSPRAVAAPSLQKENATAVQNQPQEEVAELKEVLMALGSPPRRRVRKGRRRTGPMSSKPKNQLVR